MNNNELNDLADKWSSAYRADYNGRKVSIEIIKALFDFGFNERDAKIVYYSKNLRWFFDSQGDNVKVKEAKLLFMKYLNKNIGYIKSMFANEVGRKLKVSFLKNNG